MVHNNIETIKGTVRKGMSCVRIQNCLRECMAAKAGGAAVSFAKSNWSSHSA